jgi:hypothetical protein
MKMALEASPKLGRVLDIVRTGASEASVVELRESVGAVADDVKAGRAEVVTQVSRFIEERLNSVMSQLGGKTLHAFRFLRAACLTSLRRPKLIVGVRAFSQCTVQMQLHRG